MTERIDNIGNAMTTVVRRLRGVIRQFIGDGEAVIFHCGAPTIQREMAWRLRAHLDIAKPTVSSSASLFVEFSRAQA